MLRIAIVIFALDQITKFYITNTAPLHDMAVLPHLNLHLAYNKGAAFGVLESAGGWQRWAFIAVAIITSAVILLWGKKLGKKHKLETLALSLILGGAWGNLIDRIRVGYVIDYIDFYIGNWHWYTFNVADIAICVGAVLLVLLSFKK